ncbi:MAG: DNA integrity scanning protein DisA with diadenylate cyclase activity [Patescibacteria group bacterium]|jgi:DNA integrity scanning protein DisA with diadenylate cyclase activity
MVKRKKAIAREKSVKKAVSKLVSRTAPTKKRRKTLPKLLESNPTALSTTKYKKLEETLIQTGLRVAKRGEGALFVVGKVEYKPLVSQDVPTFEVVKNPKLLESLALMDGAIVIDEFGFLTAYGVRVKSTKVFKNYGTRHSAAISAAIGNNHVVLVSEEDKKIRILRKGKMVLQIDALQKNVEKSVPRVVGLMESIGVGTVGTIGTSLLVPGLGLALLPGILVFGSSYYLGKYMQKK